MTPYYFSPSTKKEITTKGAGAFGARPFGVESVMDAEIRYHIWCRISYLI